MKKKRAKLDAALEVAIHARDRERRASFTADRVSAAVAQANRAVASDLLSAVESAAGWWERAFAGATCPAMDAHSLALLGRELLLCGNAVFWRSSASGWFPAVDWDVRSPSPAQARWRYRLNLPAPDVTVFRNEVSAAEVLHVRIGARAAEPWRGCSPLERSDATRRLLAEIERSLREEHSGPVGSVIGVPHPESQSATADAIASLAGRTILTEATESDLIGTPAAGRQSWRPERIGPMPSPATMEARESVERSVHAACGVPSELSIPGASGDAREAFRRFVAGTIGPVAALLSAELRRLGLDPAVSFEELRSADIQVRTRGLKQLVEAGIPPAQAMAIVGLGEE